MHRMLPFLGVVAALMISGFATMSALLSPGTIGASKPATMAAPTAVAPARVDQPAPPPAMQPANASGPAAETQTFSIGPPVVHQAPEPPSQAELAKSRARTAEDEPRRGFRHRARSWRWRGNGDTNAAFGRLHPVR